MGDEVKLHGTWFSPFVTRVQIVLKLKGVEYEYVEEDLKNKSPLLLKINPIYEKVPVLIHNGNPIVESLIVIEYIDEAFSGPSILPKDPYERSKARFWTKFLDDKGMPPLWKACWSKGEEREKAKEEALESLKILENEIKGKKFFGGNKIGILDVTADFFAYGIPILEELTKVKLLTEDEFPCLLKWVSNYCNDPFVKEYFPVDDPLAKEYFPPKGPLSASYKVGLHQSPPHKHAFYGAAFLESQNRRPKYISDIPA
ncbi:hypothetical protein ACS0TY_016060 [Phlomoides rotata]